MDPADLSILGCDVHSHFLPGIDDGAPDMESTLAMISGMKEFGYTKVITTPHVMSDYYRNTPEIILAKLDEVRSALDKANIEVEIEAAAEYYLDAEFLDLIKAKKLLTFGNNYVLFELPFIAEPQNIQNVIFELHLAGYKPVLAHPERYSYYHSSLERYEQFVENNVLLQLNMNSITGHYSPEVRKVSEALIDKGLITMLGSDCHHLGHQELMQRARKATKLHQLLDSGKLLNKSLLS